MKMSISSEGCGSIIVVSNRLPFVLKRNDKGQLERHASWISGIACRRFFAIGPPFLAKKLICECWKKYFILPLLISRYKSFAFNVPKSSDDYQHFKRSFIPTYYFQDSLPHLPIPELRNTCESYLRCLRPLLFDEDYDKAKTYVDRFLLNDGIECQKALIKEDSANQHTSCFSKFLLQRYLADRTPLPINYNPFLVFVEHRSELNSQIVKAANLVISSLRFYKSLKNEILEPEIFLFKPTINKNIFHQFVKTLPKSICWYGASLLNAFPLDMSEFIYLFNTSRIPVYRDKDLIKQGVGKRHLLVMRAGHFYIFDVLDENGDIVAPDVILCTLEQIIEYDKMDSCDAVALLTTEDRDVWATARNHLKAIGNSEVLDLIDTALFILVLENGSPGSDPVQLTKFFLHGDGTSRWHDKSLSLIVAKDGTAGINFERSWGDGVAVMRYFGDIHKDSFSNPQVYADTPRRNYLTVRKLEFNLDGKAINMITEAQKTYKKTCKSLKVNILDYWKYGENMCNRAKINPDALMQLSFQMAWHEISTTTASISQSCSTGMFKHGRTEIVRPCTIESQQFCKALRQSSSSKELHKLVYKYSSVHSNLTKDAMMGRGYDRHLLFLRLKAESLGLKPDLFADPAFATMSHNVVATSPIVSDCLQLGGFGPVVPDGYGIAYSVSGELLRCVITSYSGQHGAEFVSALERALDHLYIILKA